MGLGYVWPGPYPSHPMLPLTPTPREEQVFFHFSQLGEGGKGRAVLARPKVGRCGEM